MERQRSVQMRPVHEVSWPPLRRSGSRRLLVIALASLSMLVLAAGYTAWWFNAASEFRDRTLGWIENRRADGWRLAYADVSRRGFPLRLGLRFDKPVVGAPAGDWTWTGSRALLSTKVFDPGPLRLAIKGDQALEFAEGSSTGGERRSYSGSADEFTFDLVPGGWLPNGHLRVRELAVAGNSAGNGFGVARLDLVSRGDPAAATGPEASSYATELTVDGFGLPDSEAVPLCHEVAHLAFDAKLFGALEPGPWPAALAEWREAGGVVEATRLVLVCGPLTLDGEGTFALELGRPADRRDDGADPGLRGGARSAHRGPGNSAAYGGDREDRPAGAGALGQQRRPDAGRSPIHPGQDAFGRAGAAVAPAAVALARWRRSLSVYRLAARGFDEKRQRAPAEEDYESTRSFGSGASYVWCLNGGNGRWLRAARGSRAPAQPAGALLPHHPIERGAIVGPFETLHLVRRHRPAEVATTFSAYFRSACISERLLFWSASDSHA